MVLGSAAVLTRNPHFMTVKPTIVHLAVAAVMLRRGWMIRYLPEIVRRNVPEPTIVATGYAWTTLLAALGLAPPATFMRSRRRRGEPSRPRDGRGIRHWRGCPS